jgi:hypothetical protein
VADIGVSTGETWAMVISTKAHTFRVIISKQFGY